MNISDGTITINANTKIEFCPNCGTRCEWNTPSCHGCIAGCGWHPGNVIDVQIKESANQFFDLVGTEKKKKPITLVLYRRLVPKEFIEIDGDSNPIVDVMILKKQDLPKDAIRIGTPKSKMLVSEWASREYLEWQKHGNKIKKTIKSQR